MEDDPFRYDKVEVENSLKKTTFLRTRTLTGNKLHVFNQS